MSRDRFGIKVGVMYSALVVWVPLAGLGAADATALVSLTRQADELQAFQKSQYKRIDICKQLIDKENQYLNTVDLSLKRLKYFRERHRQLAAVKNESLHEKIDEKQSKIIPMLEQMLASYRETQAGKPAVLKDMQKDLKHLEDERTRLVYLIKQRDTALTMDTFKAADSLRKKLIASDDLLQQSQVDVNYLDKQLKTMETEYQFIFREHGTQPPVKT
jgi:hypothetical protein